MFRETPMKGAESGLVLTSSVLVLNRFYMAVPNQNPDLYISITDRRVNVMVTDGSFQQYAGAGLFIPFVDVEANWPFPGIVHAQSQNVVAFNTGFGNAAILHAIAVHIPVDRIADRAGAEEAEVLVVVGDA